MAHINLLPWRDERRRDRQRRFRNLAILIVLATVGAMFYMHVYLSGLIDQQQARNTYLEQEIARLDEKIAAIKALEETRDRLQARIDIIQELQQSRPAIVHLFDELPRTLPDGVYLSKLTQKGTALSLDGVAQSNARVSTYMHNLDDSPWLADPVLDVIRAQGSDTKRRGATPPVAPEDPEKRNDFTLRATQIINPTATPPKQQTAPAAAPSAPTSQAKP